MSERQCFPCTACCEGWLRANINGEPMKPGKPCQNLAEQGCAIYADRPENPCAKFMCGWLQPENGMPEQMKPTECGAIVKFTVWGGRQVISAIPVGKDIPVETIEWLTAFAREKSIPLIFSERVMENGQYIGIKRTGYGPPSFVQAVKSRIGPDDIMTF